MKAYDTIYDTYNLDDGWTVRPKLVGKEGGRQEYLYKFIDEQGDVMFVLSEYDMSILSKIYDEHNTGVSE